MRTREGDAELVGDGGDDVDGYNTDRHSGRCIIPPQDLDLFYPTSRIAIFPAASPGLINHCMTRSPVGLCCTEIHRNAIHLSSLRTPCHMISYPSLFGFPT